MDASCGVSVAPLLPLCRSELRHSFTNHMAEGIGRWPVEGMITEDELEPEGVLTRILHARALLVRPLLQRRSHPGAWPRAAVGE